jgi:ATP-dependent DNA helicase RecG
VVATDSRTLARARSGTRAGTQQRIPAFASKRALTRVELIDAPVRWPRPSRLLTPLEPGAGKMADGMAALGLRTVGELLEHLPRSSREARSVRDLRVGEGATVAVQVRAIGARPVRRRGMKPLVEASVFDATGSMRARFFNQPWLVQRYGPGTQLVLHGKATARGVFNVAHHAVGADLGGRQPDEPGEVAHYPASEGVTSTQILTLVQGVRGAFEDVTEVLSAATRAREGLPDRAGALAAMHFPQDGYDRERARARLAFEELLLAQLVFLRRRARRGARSGAHALAEAPTLTERWLAEGLPFAPTGDQLRAMATIAEDLAQPRPMQRLLMGEVGSGKTVVALYAMLRTVEHGFQVALMAPTETLAEQHFATLQRLIGAEPVSGALLTGSTPGLRREDILGKLASGELSMIVGTHALIEPGVSFHALAVAVVDEQHRFGVRQRAALDAKGTPHMLHMTATPIPRTLALAGYGDLDTSALRELPLGRQPVDTHVVVGDGGRERAYNELRRQLKSGRQAYVVCPLVEEEEGAELAGERGSDAGASVQTEAARAAVSPAPVTATARAATAELGRLREGELEGYELVLLHGGMRSSEKQQAMAAFASGKADVLVATTVIEVGIDVPNATVMLVENAERFGISQLHQLRGRVGRGEHRASCFLVAPPEPLGSAKLRAVAQHCDGFRLAEIDLYLRKEGELVGTRQSGPVQFQVASLPDDAELLERARAWAEAIVTSDPELRRPENALLGTLLEWKFGAEALEPIPA